MTAHHTRTHIVLPTQLLEEIDAVVGPRGRSKFLAEAAAEKLRRIRMVDLVDKLAGSLKDRGVPGWETAESAADCVHESRQADQARLDARLKKHGLRWRATYLIRPS